MPSSSFLIFISLAPLQPSPKPPSQQKPHTPTCPPHLFSTSKKCIARYASNTNDAPNTPNPIQSFHSAWVSKPNELKIAEPGTSISKPYLWSMRERYFTSFTMRPSKA